MPPVISVTPPSGLLRFTSWNVKGLNSQIKRNKILNHLKQLNTKIALIQETHLTIADHVKIKRDWVGQLYHSSFSSKSRDVAILKHRSVPFSMSKVISDPNGRFIIITGHINGVRLVLANVYGPNWVHIKKAEFDLLATSDAIEALHKSRYNYYEFSVKPSKLLAHQLRQTSALNHVTQISMSAGPTISPLLINDQFRDFYTSFYTSESFTEESHLESFF